MKLIFRMHKVGLSFISHEGSRTLFVDFFSVLIGTAVTISLSASWVNANPLSQSVLSQIAQSITVRVEGATQGSGVLVKRDGDRYTVLTAWHVVSSQRGGEEVDIFTSDGQKHSLLQGSIQRLGKIDMAVLSFSSTKTYALAQLGDVRQFKKGEPLLVAGFPIAKNSLLDLQTGELVANALAGVDQGYQLLYTNQTNSGMSGGVILSSQGVLLGIHGRGELDEIRTMQTGTITKTGINQGVPVSYYQMYLAGSPVIAESASLSTADDYLAMARRLFDQPNRDREIIRLASLSLKNTESAEAYFLRGFSYEEIGQTQLAVEDLNNSIRLNPSFMRALRYRGIVKEQQGNILGACEDWSKAASLGAKDASLWYRNQCA